MRSRRKSSRRKQGFPFYVPLLIAVLIVAGAIFTIRWLLEQEGTSELNGQPVATFTLLSGNARVILPNGGSSSVDSSAESVSLNVGEGVETVGTTRLEITFQNGSFARLDGNSSMMIEEFRNTSTKTEIGLKLNRGSLWVNTDEESDNENFQVTLPSSSVSMETGIIAANTNAGNDIYYGIQGNGNVSIYGDNPEDPLTINPVGLGQQINITPTVIQDLQDKRPVTLLSLIDTNFRDSNWYTYNTTLDNNGFVDTSPSLINGNTNLNDSGLTEDNSNADTENTLSDDNTSSSLPVVTVTYPKEGSTVSETIVVLKGTSTPNTAKVDVNDYVLQKYEAGDTSWEYFAAISYGNLEKGRNVFTVQGIDSSGRRGAETTVTFTYDGEEEEETAEETGPSGTPAVPVITSPVRGQKEFITSDPEIILSGTADSKAKDIVVNGYTLQRYTAGSGSWQYFAYEEYDTLKEGDNTYEVYAIGYDGSKSTSTSITITYIKSGTGTGSTL